MDGEVSIDRSAEPVSLDLPTQPESRVARNLAALAGGQAVTWTMTLAWTIIVPRIYGPKGMGLIVTAMSVTGVLAIVLGFGTTTYLVRTMVVARSDTSAIVWTGIVMRLLTSPLFLVAVIVYARIAHYGHEGALVLYLAAVATVLTMLADPIQAVFQAIERMEYLAYSNVISRSAQGVLGIALAILGFGPAGFAGCWLGVSGLVIVLNAVWLRRYLTLTLHTTGRRIVRMARESLAYWTFGLFYMIYLWIDTIMLSLMTSPLVVGWYGVPTRLFQSFMVIPVLVSTAWLPRLVSAFQEGPHELRRIAQTPLELVLVFALPVAAAGAIVAAPLIHLLYGSSFQSAVPVLIILSLCIPPMSVNIIFGTVVIAAKRQFLWTWMMIGATIVNPLVNAFLIPLTERRLGNGAVGAAISLFVTEILIVAGGFALVRRLIGGPMVARGGWRRFALSGVASAAAAGVAIETHQLGALMVLGASAITFVILAIILRIARPAEIDFARRRLRQFTHSFRRRVERAWR